jgi:hypothetical protein
MQKQLQTQDSQQLQLVDVLLLMHVLPTLLLEALQGLFTCLAVVPCWGEVACIAAACRA